MMMVPYRYTLAVTAEKRQPPGVEILLSNRQTMRTLLLGNTAGLAVAVAKPVAAAFVDVPRPVFWWLGTIALATFAKNLSKPKGPQFATRRLQDSGECPFPFVLAHDPIGGFWRHKGKLVICALIWTFLRRDVMMLGLVRWLAAGRAV